MTTKQNITQKAWSESLNFINSFLQNVEGEVGKAIRTARQQSKKSAKNIRRTVDELIGNGGTAAIRRKAIAKGGELKKEFKKFSDGVITQIKSVENVIEDGVIDNVVDKIRGNFTSTVNKLQDLEVVEYAKVKMNDTKKQVLSALEIPSHSELERLTRKLSVLEKKLNTIKRHDARH
jgi:hypothetical protein